MSLQYILRLLISITSVRMLLATWCVQALWKYIGQSFALIKVYSQVIWTKPRSSGNRALTVRVIVVATEMKLLCGMSLDNERTPQFTPLFIVSLMRTVTDQYQLLGRYRYSRV